MTDKAHRTPDAAEAERELRDHERKTRERDERDACSRIASSFTA